MNLLNLILNVVIILVGIGAGIFALKEFFGKNRKIVGVTAFIGAVCLILIGLLNDPFIVNVLFWMAAIVVGLLAYLERDNRPQFAKFAIIMVVVFVAIQLIDFLAPGVL